MIINTRWVNFSLFIFFFCLFANVYFFVFSFFFWFPLSRALSLSSRSSFADQFVRVFSKFIVVVVVDVDFSVMSEYQLKTFTFAPQIFWRSIWLLLFVMYIFFSQQKKARLDDFKYSTSPSLNTLYAFRCLFVVACFRMQFSICLHCKLFELRKKKYFISLVVQLNGQTWAYVWNAVNEIFKSFWSSRTFRANFVFFCFRFFGH